MAGYITIEDAVARMVNVGIVPIGVSLLDYLNAIVGDAEDKLEEAKQRNLPSQELDLFELCVKANNNRYEFAVRLKQHIEWELETSLTPVILKRAPVPNNTEKLEIRSVVAWAMMHYGIDRFDYEELTSEAQETPVTTSEKEAVKIAKKGLSSILAQRLYITFALAIEELVSSKKNPVGFGSVDKINVDQTANLLSSRAGITKNFDTEILKNRIEVAIAMKKLYGKN